MVRVERAFTLIELLVVVSIIAILAAMLLPAIGLVRDAARTATCGSNLRQFGIAFHAYASDEQGRWPSGNWNNLVQDYLNEDGEIGSQTVAVKYRLARCPSLPERTGGGVSLDLSYGYTGVYWNSLANASYNVPDQYFFAWASYLPSKVIVDSRVVRKSMKVVLSEMWDHAGTNVGQATWGANILNDCTARLVHRRGCNMLFADGSSRYVELPGVGVRLATHSAATTPTKATFQSDPMWRPYNASNSSYVR